MTVSSPCDGVTVHHADALAVLRDLPDESVHAVICDPPYGLADHNPEVVARAITAWASGDRERVPTGKGFMGREWDAFVPPPAVWDECLRVLKPGGHLAVFAGSRTVDLMGISIRLAGFEMRDGIAAWLYGSGFPKSRDVSKDLDRIAGAEREVVGSVTRTTMPHLTGNHGVNTESPDAWRDTHNGEHTYSVTAPATDEAREWQGWGTALKPAHEPIILARKPLAGTVAQNVTAHRTGAMNIDATRVESGPPRATGTVNQHATSGVHGTYGADNRTDRQQRYNANLPEGRWPTNVVLAHHPDDPSETECHSDCQVAALDEQSGNIKGQVGMTKTQGGHRFMGGDTTTVQEFSYGTTDYGGASRFFPTFRYQAKAPKSERPIVDGQGWPTVKPLRLMRWLVRLLLPEEACVLDPFAGSGATLEAARLEGRRAVGVERDEHAVALIHQRLAVPTGDASPVADGELVLFEAG